ncbi:MAG: ABC transporter ATP-binding protein [Thermoanaerobaculaceae bacterium]|nr:ABC transporter ATP-binding protein [Thermoanaerobaculaceae bacterium]
MTTPVIGDPPLLEVRDLQVEFRTREGIARAVNGANYTLHSGETLAVLGESGSGKSVTAQAIMGILDTPPGFVTGGEVLFKGDDLLKMSDEERRALRGESIAMVFQDALSSLNPVFPVGWQIAELFRIHRGMSRRDAMKEALEALERVNIPAAKDRIGDYPHQFSGGMRQRVMIAMAIALRPDLLIADEPTTALDVTVQAQILELMADLQREENMGLILITHDLGVVAEVADKVAVMYAGRIVEQASIEEMFDSPAHPYTVGLMDSIPSLEARAGELKAIKGLPPSLVALPPGCPFEPRCPLAFDLCRQVVPPPIVVGPGRESRCHIAEEVRDGKR